MGLLHGVFCVVLKVDQIVAGIALILLVLACRGLDIGCSPQGLTAQVPGFERLDLGPLTDLPFLGPVLFNHPVLVYLGLVSALVLGWVFTRTGLGLTIRAVGENSQSRGCWRD